MIEQWKYVENFHDYMVSDQGRVKRVTFGRGTNAIGGILKPSPHPRKGYLRVYLSKKSKKYTKAVHIMVAKAFLPNPNMLPQVNHKDGVKEHCGVDNLEWATQAQNMRHSQKLGLHGRGVYFNKAMKKWVASYFPEPRKRKHLGTFNTEEAALLARQQAVSAL